jgi:death-on-curing protein
MQFLEKDEVLAIHERLLNQFGGLPGIRDQGLLDSALVAPINRLHCEGADLSICAATYAFHITRNHPFVDGNKRVGAATAEIFLRLNGSQLTATNDEIVDLLLRIADGSLAREDVEVAFGRWAMPPA